MLNAQCTMHNVKCKSETELATSTRAMAARSPCLVLAFGILHFALE